MVIGFLEVSLPVVVPIAAIVANIYRKIQSPPPMALGCIIPKVCVVGSEEILRYSKSGDLKQAVAKHLRHQVRWSQFRVNWGYLSEQAWNTTLFQRAVRFEKLKIDPSRSALEYEQRDILVLELVDQAADMRWKLLRSEATMISRLVFGLQMDQQMLVTLLRQYRRLEEDVVALAGMADDNCFHDMLMDRLGLQRGWGIVDGGAESPA